MKYTWIQREDTGTFITVGEYIQATAPKIFMQLCAMLTVRVRDVTEIVIAAADVRDVDRYYQYIMQERPKPGRGGLLLGEGEDALQ
jgi:hypothetical protein